MTRRKNITSQNKVETSDLVKTITKHKNYTDLIFVFTNKSRLDSFEDSKLQSESSNSQRSLQKGVSPDVSPTKFTLKTDAKDIKASSKIQMKQGDDIESIREQQSEKSTQQEQSVKDSLKVRIYCLIGRI
jgi:hypothetical protein